MPVCFAQELIVPQNDFKHPYEQHFPIQQHHNLMQWKEKRHLGWIDADIIPFQGDDRPLLTVQQGNIWHCHALKQCV